MSCATTATVVSYPLGGICGNLSMERFEIRVSDAVLDDLRERLSRTRFPDQLEGAGWDYGTELGYLQELCDYWQHKFDWRAQERKFNRFDQFKTNVNGLSIHFIHARSKEPQALPLILSHGWPGSIFLFSKVIEPLRDPVAHGGRAEDAFHIVCPSLPGYGFSDPPRRPGFDVNSVAETFVKLMEKLGYSRYGAQGGDWGSIITTCMALVDPEHLCGIHLNMVVAAPPEGLSATEGLSPKELAAVADLAKFQKDETGYQSIQGSKPQTLGYGLNDSPAGLAAWIVEKFRTWSDCEGDVERCYTKDELLSNIMLYWITQTITSSTRLYYETMHSGRFAPASQRVTVPMGAAIFPREIIRPPRKWAEATYNIKRWTEMPSGGHFAALEEPDRLVEDIRAFYRDLR
ncbi:MAG: epoxide hydrolase [Deltaproteobacteria bacterium]|nr:MAG: epoxide hydrolase [Deltaproteobacteria bacterium]TDJ08611.1 MAG: epoxide hydrolase [Deltaproteobacteria bacterium]